MAKYKVSLWILITALVFIIVGVTVGVLWTVIYNQIILGQLTLTERSKSFEVWKKTPIPMYFKVYFFNWTNANEFGVSNTKPSFVEMGPYVFKEVDYKIPISWNNNDTLTFRMKKVWHFQPAMSNGSLSDNITCLNPVAATVVSSFAHLPSFVKVFLNRIMEGFNETLYIRKTAKELLFQGYEDKLLQLAKKMKTTKLPYVKFGWFHGRNESSTYDGTFNMLRGVNNIHEMGRVVAWNYSNTTTFYKEKCNQINGMIGDLWPPLLDNKTVSIFASDICTSLTLKFDNTTEHLGLTGYRYKSDETMLDNGKIDESRKCYCQNATTCQPTGTLNVSKCKFDAPVYISLPHFYMADPSYREGVVGMKPNETKHEFYITIEPKTGIPMQVRARLQINLLIQPDKDFTKFKNIKKTFIPMIWFSQEADLTPEFSDKMMIKFVMILPMLGHVTFFGIAGIGALLVIVAISMYFRTKRNLEDRQVLLKD